MRDPLGKIHKEKQAVVRVLKQPLHHEHFLHQKEVVELTENELLIPFTFRNELEVVSPLIPFVSYPHEWCNAQLYSAAELTLTIAERCEKNNWELKDASSWNVIFDGTNPIFCDHLSFQKITKKTWWAFAQYIRHFILPLCIAKYAGMDAYEAFKLNRDGLKPEQVKSILGIRRFWTRYWTLLISVKSHRSKSKNIRSNASHHKNLYSMLHFYLNGVKPQKKLSTWSNYVESRDHYTKISQDLKTKKISEWLKKTHPDWVTDFGCNTGEYSRIANVHGAKVIAIDFDHECIQQLYLNEKGNKNIYPVIADLDDIFAGRGWAGTEFEGLVTRIARVNELVLMLALIHHVAISNSIPYVKIAEFAREVTKKWLIVEFMDHSDPLVIHLCQQRDRSAEEFSIKQQFAAFNTYFDVIETHQIINTQRTLCLLKARSVE